MPLKKHHSVYNLFINILWKIRTVLACRQKVKTINFVLIKTVKLTINKKALKKLSTLLRPRKGETHLTVGPRISRLLPLNSKTNVENILQFEDSPFLFLLRSKQPRSSSIIGKGLNLDFHAF